MSGPIPESFATIGPWQRYIAKERAARGSYLATVERAHHEYLSGPWPDREAYQHVELSAWVTYYAAGREAWQYYTREVEPPPPPPPARSEQSPAAAEFEQDQMARRYWSSQPGFTPNTGGTQ